MTLMQEDTPQEDAPQPKRLTRSTTDSVVGGVAGGLGRYFGVDPILFRIGFAVLSFVGGIGLIAYLILLSFVPADDDKPLSGVGKAAAITGAVLVGCVLLFLDGSFFFGTGLLILALLAVAGVVLWRAIGGDGDRSIGRAILTVALFGFLAFLMACLAVGVGIAAALGGDVVIASLAVATGLVLVATAFLGGARWLIVPALALVLPLAVVAAADLDFEGGIGDHSYRPATASELRDRYEVGMGELDVDLRDVDLVAGRTDVALDVGIGHALVRVPANACVTSDVTMGAGAIDVLDRAHDGVDLEVAESATPPAGRPHLHIAADVGIGAIEVVREGFSPDLGDRDRGWFSDEGDNTYEGGLNCA
jgi:phage shock protein PspC (stress-responsive transcriptional regulator)